jgi:hypothetical protein
MDHCGVLKSDVIVEDGQRSNCELLVEDQSKMMEVAHHCRYFSTCTKMLLYARLV